MAIRGTHPTFIMLLSTQSFICLSFGSWAVRGAVHWTDLCCWNILLFWLSHRLYQLIFSLALLGHCCHLTSITAAYIANHSVSLRLNWSSQITTGDTFCSNKWFFCEFTSEAHERHARWFPQCYLCTKALCHSSTDPSHWCTRWQEGLVLESVQGHMWTEPQLQRRTAGQWLWSFHSGGMAHSSGHAQKLGKEMIEWLFKLLTQWVFLKWQLADVRCSCFCVTLFVIPAMIGSLYLCICKTVATHCTWILFKSCFLFGFFVSLLIRINPLEGIFASLHNLTLPVSLRALSQIMLDDWPTLWWSKPKLAWQCTLYAEALCLAILSFLFT